MDKPLMNDALDFGQQLINVRNTANNEDTNSSTIICSELEGAKTKLLVVLELFLCVLFV